MRRCTRVGLEVTKRCNWRCQTCFYRWRDDFNAAHDVALSDLQQQLVSAKNRGCDHAVLVGWGETGLYPRLMDLVDYTVSQGMTMSMITNGTCGIDRYKEAFDHGLNHLHISVHGTGDTLNTIAAVPGAASAQQRLLEWLKGSEKPWRSNTTLQLANYRELPNIVQHIIDHGAFHVVLLGFLPHYDWEKPENMRKVAVHPGELRPYIEQAAQLVLDAKKFLTIRYHPMCHLSPEYRKYVVNARYVLYDPWEWDYGTAGMSDTDHWMAAMQMGNSVAIQEAPCRKCALYTHCGGWNKTYAHGFDGANLTMIPMDLTHAEMNYPGALHDQNPANAEKGWV